MQTPFPTARNRRWMFPLYNGQLHQGGDFLSVNYESAPRRLFFRKNETAFQIG